MRSVASWRVEVRVSFKRVKISMRFPCKLQVGLKINQKQVVSEQTVDLKSSEARFHEPLSMIFQYPSDYENSQKREPIRNELVQGQAILYAVYAKRKIAIGFIGLNLREIIEGKTETFHVQEKWERCPDKSATAEIEIRRVTGSLERSRTVQSQQGDSVTEEESFNETIKKTNSVSPVSQGFIKIPNLKLLSSPQILNQYRTEKFLKVPHKRFLEVGSESNIEVTRIGACNINQDSFVKQAQSRLLETSDMPFSSNVDILPKSPANNFYSSDQQYISLLRIRVNADMDLDQHQDHTHNGGDISHRFVRCPSGSRVGSYLESPRQATMGHHQYSREALVLQKKLALTEKYFKAQLSKFSRKLLQSQQEKQTLTVQLSLKEDQIKQLYQEVQVQRSKPRQSHLEDGFQTDRSTEDKPHSVNKLLQLITRLQDENQQLSNQIQHSRKDMENERVLKLNLQEATNSYYVRAENDRKTISLLNQELIKLNSIIKQLLKSEREKTVSPPLSHRSSPRHGKTPTQADVSSNLDQLESEVNNIQEQFNQKDKTISKIKEKNKELQLMLLSAQKSASKYERREQQYSLYLEEKEKYLADIECLARQVSQLERRVKKHETKVVPSLNSQIKLLQQKLAYSQAQLKLCSYKLESAQQRCQKAVQELKQNEGSLKMDEQNIREFEKELAEKYKVIYNLETSLKNERNKSRSLSQSVQRDQHHLGRLIEFSFSNNCNHNFQPLCTKIKDISNKVRKSKFEVIRKMNIDVQQSEEVFLIKQFSFFEQLLKKFATVLQEADKEKNPSYGSSNHFLDNSPNLGF